MNTQNRTLPKVANAPILIGAVDDHAMLREGVACVIEVMPGAKMTLNVESVQAAIAYLRENPLDVLLLDICLGGSNQSDGLEAIAKLLEASPQLKIIMFSHSDKEQFVIEALIRGAHGYLLKESAPVQIQRAIRAAHAGMFSVSPPTLLASALKLVRLTGPLTAPPLLSEKEISILQQVIQGLSNREIAHKLFLAESTVKKYCLNAMGKLGCKSRGTAAITAMRAGLIQLEAEPGEERASS